MTDEQPIETSSECVSCSNGVKVLVVHFTGKYGFGCQGNGDGRQMRKATRQALFQHPDAVGVVLDATQLAYEWGDMIGEALPHCALPCVWAGSELCPGLCSYVQTEMDGLVSEWLFPTIEEAVAVVAERHCAEEFDLHDSAGNVRTRTLREPRDLRQISFEGGRVEWEDLWFERKLIERLKRDAQGNVALFSQWPYPDGLLTQTEACRLGARISYEQGRLRELDFGFAADYEDDELSFSPRELAKDWHEVLACLPDLSELALRYTDATDRDVRCALDRCPGLEKLSLDGTRVTSAVFEILSNHPGLRRVSFWEVALEPEQIRAFALATPRLEVSYSGMFDKKR